MRLPLERFVSMEQEEFVAILSFLVYQDWLASDAASGNVT